jgi:hypothetical protein
VVEVEEDRELLLRVVLLRDPHREAARPPVLAREDDVERALRVALAVGGLERPLVVGARLEPGLERLPVEVGALEERGLQRVAFLLLLGVEHRPDGLHDLGVGLGARERREQGQGEKEGAQGDSQGGLLWGSA